MANSNHPSIANLKRAIEIAEKIETLQAQLAALVGRSASVAAVAAPAPAVRNGKPGRPKGGKRQLSPEARERIANAQRARWAKARGNGKSAEPAVTEAPAAPAKGKGKGKKKGGKRNLTPAGREKLSASLKARWAARKKGGEAPNRAKK